MRFDVEKLDSYSILPNEYLRNKNLTLKAKGLLSIIYSLPNEWDFSMNGLCVITNTGITALRNTLAELELQGYIARIETRNEKGQYEYIYKVFLKKQKTDIKNCTSLRRFKTYLNAKK